MRTTLFPGALRITTATSLRESFEDSTPIAQEARGLLDRPTLVLAEQDLGTVLALVGVDAGDPRELCQSFN
jgi:hypothetical protein